MITINMGYVICAMITVMYLTFLTIAYLSFLEDKKEFDEKLHVFVTTFNSRIRTAVQRMPEEAVLEERLAQIEQKIQNNQLSKK